VNHQAIRNVYPQAIVIDDGAGAFDAQGNLIEIDQQLVDAEIARLQSEYAATQYQRDRAKAYPSFADQFDLLYHGGYDAWKLAIDEIKAKYPKVTK
jgi:hypothetical protein